MLLIDPTPCVTVITIMFTFPVLCSEQGKIYNIGQKTIDSFENCACPLNVCYRWAWKRQQTHKQLRGLGAITVSSSFYSGYLCVILESLWLSESFSETNTVLLAQTWKKHLHFKLTLEHLAKSSVAPETNTQTNIWDLQQFPCRPTSIYQCLLFASVHTPSHLSCGEKKWKTEATLWEQCNI